MSSVHTEGDLVDPGTCRTPKQMPLTCQRIAEQPVARSGFGDRYPDRDKPNHLPQQVGQCSDSL
jgi:hypothetical protein